LHHIVQNIEMVSISSVEITEDLHSAKVFISIIGDKKEKICQALNEQARHIGYTASKKVVMRTFPKLEFFIDVGLEKQLRICDILSQVLPEEVLPEGQTNNDE